MLEWQSFWESFEASVHKNSSLAEIEKLNYLISFLEGHALKSVIGLPRTSASYSEALEILKTRYGDRQVIINAHTEKLFHVRPIFNSDVISLRQFYDYVQIHVRALNTLGVKSETFNSLTQSLLLSKLPNSVKLKFAEQQGENDWTIESLLNLLLTEIKIREKCHILVSDKRHNSYDKSHNFNKFHDNKTESRNSTFPRFHNSTMRNFSVQTTPKCSFCNDTHAAKLCKSFTDVQSRRLQAMKLKLLLSTNNGNE